jgi:hypothetical protein
MTNTIIKRGFLCLIVVLSGGFMWWQGGTVDWSKLFQDALKGEASNSVQQVEDLTPKETPTTPAAP